jgi:hypothetical protein
MSPLCTESEMGMRSIGLWVLARIIFKRAKKHVATTMTAVSVRYLTGIFLQ